jgi:CDP-4-dehydro-6-deoxyglucose reductase, E3
VSKIRFECRLRELKTLTPTVRELVIDFINPNVFSFRAGQFAVIQVPGPDGKDVPRAYSIASQGGKSYSLTLLIKLLDRGIASDYVRTLEPGASLTLTGPFGRLFFKEPAPTQIIMLATGAGLSQHLSYLTTHGATLPNTKFHLLFGVWNESEMFYEAELQALSKSLPNFSFEYVLDKPTGQWNGRAGFITQDLDRFEYLKKDTHFYMCGNPNMIKSAKDLLREKGFPEEKILAEAFFMAPVMKKNP